jgi:hypothetical protein
MLPPIERIAVTDFKLVLSAQSSIAVALRHWSIQLVRKRVKRLLDLALSGRIAGCPTGNPIRRVGRAKTVDIRWFLRAGA